MFPLFRPSLGGFTDLSLVVTKDDILRLNPTSDSRQVDATFSRFCIKELPEHPSLLSHQVGNRLQSEKTQPAIPTVICPPIPSPRRLARPSSSPAASPPPTPAAPPCSASPSGASLSSDLERHHHLPKAAVLPEKVELSQSPRGVQPSVPPCSYGSVTIEQSHMGAPLQRPPNPQRSHRNSQHARCAVCCSFMEAERNLMSTSFNFEPDEETSQAELLEGQLMFASI